jgi:hypothetical protein
MTETEYHRLYLCEPESIDFRLLDLARSYYRRAEEYDRTVCTGPIGRDGIMPATSREFAAINRNANELLQELKRKAAELGFGTAEFAEAMRIASREPIDAPPQAG